MKLRGGYNVLLSGRPSGRVEVPPEQEDLYLPLQSRRFTFSELRVEDGEQVYPGQVLAKDPGNYSLPLLAPRAGIARLSAAQNHIKLESVTTGAEEPYHPDEELAHVPKDMGSAGMKRYKLLALGAWQFFHDVHTDMLPDPYGIPSAVIVSTIHLEPFVARGDVQLSKRLRNFTRGLEHLQSLLEYQPIYLILPDVASEFASQVRETLRGYAWVKMVEIPRKYPFDDFAVLARALGMKPGGQGPVWGLRTGGVLAIDRALTLSRPCTVRIVAIGGPAANNPVHVKVVPGYPLQALLESRVASQPVRIINGGALTGETVVPSQLGLDVECDGLTILPEHRDREFLAFTRPGWGRRSYGKSFLSSVRGPFPERLTTALRGERRACIACGYCEEVCPAGIMPHLIHKYLYQDILDDAERVRLDLCVRCGLCSFVCPSKIELRREFVKAQEMVARELHTEKAEA
jgi:Na+-transporting NADH:ubiquinone oxidoreductase subunit A